MQGDDTVIDTEDEVTLRRRTLPTVVVVIAVLLVIPELLAWLGTGYEALTGKASIVSRRSLIETFALIPSRTLGHADFSPLPARFWNPACFAEVVDQAIALPCSAQRAIWAARFVGGAEWWRLITHIFLHGGVIHLALNALAFLHFAPSPARRMGPVRFFGFFIACGLAGGFAFMVFGYGLDNLMLALGWSWPGAHLPMISGQIPLVGASGAIFGVIMADLRTRWERARRQREDVRLQPPGAYLRQMIVLGLVVNIAFNLMPTGISGTAHIGGALAGFLLTPWLEHNPHWQAVRRARARARYQRAAGNRR